MSRWLHMGLQRLVKTRGVLLMDKLRFYEAVAQVIPVLLLALAVGERWFQTPRSLGWQARLASFLMVLLLSVGEFAALHALYTGKPTYGHLYWVLLSLGILSSLLLLAATEDRRS